MPYAAGQSTVVSVSSAKAWYQRAGHWLCREWRLLVGLVVGLLCLVLAVRGVSVSAVTEALIQVRWGWSMLAVVCVVLASLAKAARWRILFYPQSICFFRVWSIFLVGQMLNVVLPTRVGEVGRIYLIGESKQISKMSTLSTVIIEKMANVVMLLLSLAGLALWPAQDAISFPAWLRKSALGLGLTAILGLGILVLCVYYGRRLWQVGRRLLRPLPASMRERVDAWARSGLEGFGALRYWPVSVQVWGWSLIIWCLATLSHYFVFIAMGLSLSMYVALFLLSVILVGVTVPAPGKLGVFHYLCVLTLSLFAVDRGTALSYSVVMYLVAFAPDVILGLCFLWRENLQLWRRHS